MPPHTPDGEPARPRLDQLAGRADLPLPEVIRRACEAAADALGVERVGVWLFVNGDRALRCVSLFERSTRRHSKGACLPLAEPSEYVRAVSEAPLLACEYARSDPRTAELDAYLAPNGITSLLDAPLVRDDRLLGVVSCEHVGPPRSWTDAERATARRVAELVVEKMKAAEAGLRAPPPPPAPDPAPAAPSPSPRGGAAHDFRNVLAEIRANAELIALVPGLPPVVTARLEKITAAADRGAGLIRWLLEPPPKDDDDTGEHEPLPAASAD